MFSKSHSLLLVACGGSAIVAFGCISMANANTIVSANVVTNGDFSANAAAYTVSPGTGRGGNPTAPTGWAFSSASYSGINGPDTGFYGSAGYQPFAPASTVGVGDFAFLQYGTMSITQTISTTAGEPYTLSYAAAGRVDGPSTTMEVILTDATSNTQITTQTPAITAAAFNDFTLNFAASSGLTTLEFLNTSPSNASNGTADVSNVSLAAVPEPATLGVFALGGMALLLVGRRRKNRA